MEKIKGSRRIYGAVFLVRKILQVPFMSKVLFTSIPMVGRKGMPTKNIHMFLYMRGEELKKKTEYFFSRVVVEFYQKFPILR